MGWKRFCSLAISILILIMASACSSKMEKPPLSPSPAVEKSVKNNVYLETENVGGLKESELMKKIRQHQLKINSAAADAKFDPVSWNISQSEEIGRKINVQKTLDIVLNAEEDSKVNLVVEEVQPKIRAQDLRGKVVELSGFTTPLLDRQESRLNNIEIAAQKLDYKKVAPGGEFSFNKTIGRRTEAKGYEEAPIIIRTEEGPKKGKGVGGGVCQVATTLYNAVSKAGLLITERHEHSKDVGYVPDGRDATVSYGSVDFKFVNSRNYPIMIRAFMTKKTLTIKILENRG